MKLFSLATLAASLALSGCVTVGPDFKSPTAALDPSFVAGGNASVGDITANAWWQQYRDPLLTRYVESGLGENLSVALARERVTEAEAEVRSTGLNAALSGSVSGTSSREGGSTTKAQNVSNASFSPAVVVDLFGGLRRSRESAEANVDAARADLQEVRLEWLASMIEAYANARYYQQAAALTQGSIKARSDTLAITKRQFAAGDATDYEVAEAEALLRTAEADLPEYNALFKSNVFAIANLLNQPAEPILAEMQKPGRQLRTPTENTAGIPSDLLRNRPDLRYQEALLHAAVANVGVAEAAMLPSISLSGTISMASAGTHSWSFGPELSLPILNQGALSATRDAKISLARQAELTWRSDVSNAVKDVQVAMSNLSEYRKRASSLGQASSAYSKALSVERENYKNGAITLLDLINVDLEATSSQISAASAVNNAALEWATLQVAAGAGSAIPGKTQGGSGS